jgi:hypothetical protein
MLKWDTMATEDFIKMQDKEEKKTVMTPEL